MKRLPFATLAGITALTASILPASATLTTTTQISTLEPFQETVVRVGNSPNEALQDDADARFFDGQAERSQFLSGHFRSRSFRRRSFGRFGRRRRFGRINRFGRRDRFIDRRFSNDRFIDQRRFRNDRFVDEREFDDDRFIEREFIDDGRFINDDRRFYR